MSYNDHSVTTTTTAASAIENHVKFWDRKNKGYITPVDTVFGFINLGYGLVISITLGTFLGVLVSYSTQDSWIPDVLCRTRTEKLQKGPKGEPYNSIGQLDLELFEALFSKHAKSDISGNTITFKELMEWNEATFKDPLTWSATTLEWMAIYLLVGSKGVVKKEDIQAAYDGTLFYKVRDRNKHHRTIMQGASTADANVNNNHLLNVSGVKVSKSYIHQLESQVSRAVHVLPSNTVSLLDTRLRHWLSFVSRQQKQQQSEVLQGQPILKGVPTPVTTRRPLFIDAGGNDDDNNNDDGGDGKDTTYGSSSLFDGGLTGVMGINLLDRAVPLTGVQNNKDTHDDDVNDNVDNGIGLSGVKGDLMVDDERLDNDDYGNGIHDTTPFSMAGVRVEKDDDNYDNPRIDWLQTGQLTGVSPSTSATTSLVAAPEHNNMDDNDMDKQQEVALDEGSDLPNVLSTPPLTETSSVTSDMDASDDTLKDRETELNSNNNNNNNTTAITTSKKKNKKNKKKNKQQQQQQQQQAPTPPAKDNILQEQKEETSPTTASSTPPFTGSPSSFEYNDLDDSPASPSDFAEGQTKHSTTSDNTLKTAFHHHSTWSSTTQSMLSDD